MIRPQASPPPPEPNLPSAAASHNTTSTTAAVVKSNDPVLCGHCGRTASNGISCQGICVADSGY